MLACSLGPLLVGALLQSPLLAHIKRNACRPAVRLAVIPDDEGAARISTLEECIEDLDATTEDWKTFGALMEEWVRLKTEGMRTGSSEWSAVVVEAEQRTEAFRWASQQQAAERGQAFVRDRDRAERKAAEGLAPGSSEWAMAMSKASAENARAYREAEMQMAAARGAANHKRAALLGILFDDGSSAKAPTLATDAALDLLFNSGYDVEGGGGEALTQDELNRMKGVIASASTALKKNGKDTALLLRRAALLVALGEPALARKDYERVLELDPANPEAQKYVDLAGCGAAFDPYETLGVLRDADTVVISAAFRRLAKQWHPDRWISASADEQL